MKAQNIPEFIALIKRYESITLEEIEQNPFINGDLGAQKLTGFGNRDTCTLCISVKNECNKCIYETIFNCVHGVLTYSYFNIKDAETPEELLIAFHNRAKALREFAKTKGIEIDERIS
jgi:hypothetical protein